MISVFDGARFDKWMRQVAAGSFALAGVLTVPFWFVHPAAADPRAPIGDAMFAAMQSFRFALINRVFIAIVLACALGAAALLSAQRERLGVSGAYGALLSLAGSSLFVGLGVVNGFVAPILASIPDVRDAVTTTGAISAAGFGPVMVIAGLTFASGNVLLAIAGGRRGILPPAVATGLATSAPILGLSPLMPLSVRAVGCAIFGVSYLAIAATLLWPRDMQNMFRNSARA